MDSLAALAQTLRASPGLAAKADISRVAARLGLSRVAVAPVGDDCAALPDGDGFLLLAIEGFINEFVAADPWFAGWCGVMVNLSDVAAMGGRALAVVDALWAPNDERAGKMLDGMRAASECYGVPIVGGHSNLSCDRGQLSVAILGRAKKLLTSFDARPGDRLVMAVDLRGAYRPPFLNWQAALDAPATRLRGDLALLPQIAEAGLSRAGKDISQAGLVGTAAMLAECSGVGVEIDIAAVPRPDGVALDKWLQSFPSFGFLLAVAPADVQPVLDIFRARDIAAAEIGGFNDTNRVTLAQGSDAETIWDFAQKPLLGCTAREAASS
jgi:AIR synthase-related protein